MKPNMLCAKHKAQAFNLFSYLEEYFDLKINCYFLALSISKSVLPVVTFSVSSYNINGHFDLKLEILDYKHVIGKKTV